MIRVLAGAFCALTLAGCASWLPADFMPSLSSPSAGPAVELTLDSEPQGADAKTSVGPSCRTPCAIMVPASAEFSVTFSLQGFQPQTLGVKPVISYERPDPLAEPAEPQLSPNPLVAQLTPVAPPPAAKKKAPPKKKAAPKQAAPT